MSADQLVLLPLWYVVFLLSITCHEGAHAYAAYRGGDPTAYLGGQVSLNPIPHIQRELWGTVLIPLLTFLNMGWMMGWASAPYDALWEARHPKRAAVMAAAGPLANLGLAILGFAVLKIGLLSEVWVPPAVSGGFDRLVVPVAEDAGLIDGFGRFCSILFSLNLVLFVFNLIPLPPMDGSTVLAGLFEPARDLRDRLRNQPFASFAGLLVAWVTFPYIFGVIYPPVIHLLWGG